MAKGGRGVGGGEGEMGAGRGDGGEVWQKKTESTPILQSGSPSL